MHYISVPDRNAWRSWLEKNHASENEVWLAYYKKHTGKALSLTSIPSKRRCVLAGSMVLKDALMTRGMHTGLHPEKQQ